MIRDLRRENRRLRKENEYLKHLSMQYDVLPEDEDSPEQKAISSAVRRTHTLNANNYFSYMIKRFRSSRSFLLFDKTRFAMKGFKFAKKMWMFFVGFFAVLGISAQFLLIVVALVVFVPAALIVSAGIGVYAYFSHRKRNKILKSLCADVGEEKVYLVFLPKDNPDGYFLRTAEKLTDKGYVFFVTQSFRDCDRKSFLQIGDRMFRIHIGAYFSFARKLQPEKTVKVYL